MQQAEIYSRLNEIARDVFDDDSIELSPATTARDIPAWDSVNHINLIIAIETRFGIKFRTSEFESLQNVGSLAGIIESKLPK